MIEPIHYKETQYGFEYGSAKVTRIHSDTEKGWVVIGIQTPKGIIEVYATKTGKIRVWDGERRELKPEASDD
jgi:hypothetical protein